MMKSAAATAPNGTSNHMAVTRSFRDTHPRTTISAATRTTGWAHGGPSLHSAVANPTMIFHQRAGSAIFENASAALFGNIASLDVTRKTFMASVAATPGMLPTSVHIA